MCRGYRFPHPTSAPFGTPPSIGRRECPCEPLPLEGAAERSKAGLASFFAAKPPPLCLPHRERGTAPAVDRVLSQTAYLRTIFPALFHTASTLSGSLRSPPSPRGEGFVRRYSFSPHISCIRSDDARKAAFSYRCLPHWGRGTASAVDRVLSQAAHLRRSFPLFFIPLVPYPARFARHLPTRGRLCVGDSGIPIQPPPLRGTSFHRKEGGSVHASPFLWKGLPSAARRGWLPFLRRSRLLFAFPIGEGGPRQRWIGCSRKRRT